MFLYILIFILSLLTYFYMKLNNSDYWSKQKVVFVAKTNIFGITWEFITGNRSLAEIYKDIYEKYSEEPYVGIFSGSKPELIIRDPENIQAVLASDFQSFNSRGILSNPNDLLADNVLFIDNFKRWKLIRQKITPIFTSSRLKNMFYILEQCGKDFADFVRANEKLRTAPFDLLYTYTSASIAAAVFGIDTQNSSTMDSPLLEMSRNTLTPSLIGNVKIFIATQFPFLFKLLKLKTFGKYEKFFIGIVKKVMRSRKIMKHKVHDFIDLCLEIQKSGTMKDASTNYELEPTDEVLAAQAFFFFIAGADTTANTMHFTLLELCKHRDILSRLHKEIDETFDKCGNKPLYEDIDKLQYLEMVINEAMRMYPPIGLLNRKCTNATVLPVGNLKIEKNLAVIVPVLAIHRDEKYYPNPEEFDPERFSPNNISNLVKYTYLPFGEGNRACIGTRFARIQVKTGLAWLLRRFTLEAQNIKITNFEKSAFAVRAPDAKYTLLLRENSNMYKTASVD